MSSKRVPNELQARSRQGLGKVWKGSGQALGKGLGMVWTNVWARFGPGLGQVWARTGPGLGHVWRGLSEVQLRAYASSDKTNVPDDVYIIVEFFYNIKVTIKFKRK